MVATTSGRPSHQVERRRRTGVCGEPSRLLAFRQACSRWGRLHRSRSPRARAAIVPSTIFGRPSRLLSSRMGLGERPRGRSCSGRDGPRVRIRIGPTINRMWKSIWTLLCAVTLALLPLVLQLLLGPQLVRDKGDAGVGHPSQLAGFGGGRAGPLLLPHCRCSFTGAAAERICCREVESYVHDDYR
jgi:hypothetical protein